MVVRWTRVAYSIGAWLYLLAVVVQVFLAGLGVFDGPLNWPTHIEFGYAMGLILPVLLVLGLLARVPRSTLLWLVALLVDYIVQSALPNLRDVSPYLAALHPVNGLLIFAIALVHALRARELIRAHQRPATLVESPALSRTSET
jgi:hypothetical protein